MHQNENNAIIFSDTANENILGAKIPKAVASGFTLKPVEAITKNLVETSKITFSGLTWQAQTFTIAEKIKLDSVVVKLAKTDGTIEDSVYCEIRDVLGNIPTTYNYGTRSVLVSSLPLDKPAEHTFDYSYSNIYLEAGTYSIVLSAPNAISGFAIVSGTNYASYNRGTRLYSDNAGVIWTPTLTNELYFKINGEEVMYGGVNLAKGNDENLKNFIGFVNKDYSKSTVAEVRTVGIVDGWNGALEMGKDYHLDKYAGEITTTPVTQQLVGRALSRDKLLIINQPS